MKHDHFPRGLVPRIRVQDLFKHFFLNRIFGNTDREILIGIECQDRHRTHLLKPKARFSPSEYVGSKQNRIKVFVKSIVVVIARHRQLGSIHQAELLEKAGIGIFLRTVINQVTGTYAEINLLFPDQLGDLMKSSLFSLRISPQGQLDLFSKLRSDKLKTSLKCLVLNKLKSDRIFK